MDSGGQPGDTPDQAARALPASTLPRDLSGFFNDQSDLSRTNTEPLREARFQNDYAHLDPSRWWFASSAFPMIAGTLGPVASAFSVCALVRQWLQHLPPGANMPSAVYIADPPWLIIINAVQLAMALVSNVFLLLNMAKRVRFSIAQPITITGWYISAVCLISLASTAAGPLLERLEHPEDEYRWSQAYFYGVWAAILYFVDASLMTVTFWGASSGYYSKDFNLTPTQRTLMLQTILILVYLLLGALLFSKIEGWNYLDTVYWANVTLFTVGFGDFAPATDLGRALLIPYALVGVLSLGLVVSSIRSLILERGRRRLDARMEEKNRRRVIRALKKQGHEDIITPLPRELTIDRLETDVDGTLPDEFERRQCEFALMRKIQKRASRRRRWLAMAISTSSMLVLWLVGALVFLKCEKSWSYFDALTFCFVSLTTIGYGDRVPISNAGKSFFVFWSLLALPTMTVLISNASDTVVKVFCDATLRIGNITILPGDEGFAGNATYVANRLTCGRVFTKAEAGVLPGKRPQRAADNAEKPPPPRGRSVTKEESVSSSQVYRQSVAQPLDIEHSRQGMLVPPDMDHHSLHRVRQRLDALPTGYELCLLLISEIQTLSKHVRAPEPRCYTFEEWAWYLGLIGEDERDPDQHRKAQTKEKPAYLHRKKHKHRHRGKSKHGKQHQQPRHHRRELSPPQGETPAPVDHDEPFKWSWVGIRSPLMGGQEESEWIMERLMDRLQESLWLIKNEDMMT